MKNKKIESSIELNFPNINENKISKIESELLHFLSPEICLNKEEIQEKIRNILSEICLEINSFMEEVKNKVYEQEKLCLIKNIPFNNLNDEVKEIFVMGLHSFIANPSTGAYLQPNSNILWRHVKPIEGGKFIANSMKECPKHTDSSNKASPEDSVALWCVRSAKKGGDSLIWKAPDLIKEMSSDNKKRKALKILREIKFPFIGSTKKKEDIFFAPIIEGNNFRYRRGAIEDAVGILGKSLSSEQKFALDELDKMFELDDLGFQIPVKTGDAIIIHNKEIIHGRTPFSDPDRHHIKTRGFRE